MARKVSKKIWRPLFEGTFIGPVQVKNARTPSQNFEAKCHRGQVATVKANWWCQWDNAMEFEAKFPAFNIRVDSMDQRKMWPPLLKSGKRCIFPIDAFYEWPIKGKGIPPVKIMLADREPYSLAGLWSR